MPDSRTPDERDHVAGELNPDGKPTIRPGSIVEHDGERRVVVDVSEETAVLRYPDDDPRRTVDHFGGDMFLTAAPLDELTVVGHIG